MFSQFRDKYPSIDYDGCKRIFTIVSYLNNKVAARKRQKGLIQLAGPCVQESNQAQSRPFSQPSTTDMSQKRGTWFLIFVMIGMIGVGYQCHIWQRSMFSKESYVEQVA